MPGSDTNSNTSNLQNCNNRIWYFYLVEFKDYFSRQAALYAQSRPTYPEELFDYLAGLVREKNLCWDCATGNGQAAVSLSKYFKKVIATDGSKQQLAVAPAIANIEYREALAEKSGLPDHCTDLITVAQAAHWFDPDKFYAEARRVAKKGSILAIWTYSEAQISPEIDKIVEKFEYGFLEKYWPDQRWYVRNKYQTLPFPFKAFDAPILACKMSWNKAQWLNYVQSWSAYEKYKIKNGAEPLPVLLQDLDKLWPDAEIKSVTWPIHLKCTRLGE